MSQKFFQNVEGVDVFLIEDGPEQGKFMARLAGGEPMFRAKFSDLKNEILKQKSGMPAWLVNYSKASTLKPVEVVSYETDKPIRFSDGTRQSYDEYVVFIPDESQLAKLKELHEKHELLRLELDEIDMQWYRIVIELHKVHPGDMKAFRAEQRKQRKQEVEHP